MSKRTEIRSFIIGTLGMAFLLSLMPFSSYAQIGTRVVEEADTHWLSQKYDEAIPLYRQHLNANPEDGRSWYRLGYSYMSTQQDAKAPECFDNAIKENFAPINSQYNLACAVAKTGDNDRALKELEDAIAMGYTNTAQIGIDADLRDLRDTQIYKDLFARSQRPAQHYDGAQSLTNLSGRWAISTEDDAVAHARGRVLNKGFTQQLTLDLDGERYLHLNLQFSAPENKWYAAGGDSDGIAYTGKAEVSTNRIKIDGKRADGSPTRLSIVWSDESHADLKIEDRTDGSWLERSIMIMTESVDLDTILNGGR